MKKVVGKKQKPRNWIRDFLFKWFKSV